jgi:hypothetical protein
MCSLLAQLITTCGIVAKDAKGYDYMTGRGQPTRTRNRNRSLSVSFRSDRNSDAGGLQLIRIAAGSLIGLLVQRKTVKFSGQFFLVS